MDSKKLIKFLAIESRFIESKMRNEIMMFKTSGALKNIVCALLILLTGISSAFATGENENITPKIAYVNVSFPKTDTSLYVGQNIEVKYTLTLLSGAKLVSTDVLDMSTKNNVVLKNKNASWQSDTNGMLSSTYVYNIVGKDVTIPPLKIKVVSADYEEELIAPGATLRAVELTSNANYISVIADSFEVVDYREKEYDENNNIVIFQFESIGAVLNTMKIAQYPMQGLEDSKVVDGVTYGIYYVVLDKSIRQLSFDYFNITQHQFVNINLPINILQNTIEEGGDIKPRNTILMFKNLLVGGLIVFVILVWVVFKKLRKVSAFALLVLVLLLGYNVFFSATSGVAQVGASVSIVPTHNSTITELIKVPTRVAIIGEYEDYYKVMIESKVGWIRKEYVSKN
ncbi:hypothetical protein [Helicobacter typhlonius]|uniref:hypothetical protein n=1 Tax=Helicobacter typhlonius TaxID=76936 RepID=UPI002FE25B31